MDELLQRPSNPTAERAVVCSMLFDPSKIGAVLERVSSADFEIDFCRDAFVTLARMDTEGKNIDITLLLEEMRRAGVYAPEGREILSVGMDECTTAAFAESYASTVRECAGRRRLLDIAMRASQGNMSLDEMREAMEAAAGSELPSSRPDVSLLDLSLRYADELTTRMKSDGRPAGLPTGYPELDRMTGGLMPGNMIVLAARAGMGKSALALNIAIETAKLSKKTVIYFSLEMSALELCERVYAAGASIDTYSLRDGRLDEEQLHRFSRTAGRICEYDLRVADSPNLDIGDIARLCRRANPVLVVIDHIGLIRPSGRFANRRETMDAVSRSIKCLAKDLHIPVIAVAQLNREIMSRGAKKPVLSDLRDSGAIEQDADLVLFIDRPSYYDSEESEREASLIVAKNRHGKTGTVPLLWYGQYQRFDVDWTAGGGTDETAAAV